MTFKFLYTTIKKIQGDPIFQYINVFREILDLFHPEEIEVTYVTTE